MSATSLLPPAGEQPPAATRSEWLLAVCTAALVAFHYFARADTLGVYSPGRGWNPLTLRPLPPAAHFAVSALLLALAPVLGAAVAGVRPRALGLGLGNLRSGLGWIAFGVPVAVLAGRIGSMDPAMRTVYPLDPGLAGHPGAFVSYALVQFLYFGAWEVMFRGALLFGLSRRVGFWPANLVQTALSVTAHFGRAQGETLAAFAFGPLFGWISYRVRSVWPIAIVHWAVGVSLDWFILAG